MSTISYNFYEQFKEKAHIFFIHTPKMSIIQQFPIKDPFFSQEFNRTWARQRFRMFIYTLYEHHTYIYTHS